jgi:hypothetical protein
MHFKQKKERPWSDKMFAREKYRSLFRRNREPDSLAMTSVETVMLGAICSCVALAEIAAQLGS